MNETGPILLQGFVLMLVAGNFCFTFLIWREVYKLAQTIAAITVRVSAIERIKEQVDV